MDEERCGMVWESEPVGLGVTASITCNEKGEHHTHGGLLDGVVDGKPVVATVTWVVRGD